MKGRDGARRGFAVGRVPYTGQIVLTDDLRSLRYGSFVTKRLLDFVILAMQAENIELCDASVPEAFSPAEPALGPHGPSRLARALMLTDPVPRSSTGRLWKRRHFVDLRLLDVVCCLHWIDEDRYAVPMLDLWGHGLHYFDSMRGGVDRHLEIEYAADILAWAETLGKLLGILELMSDFVHSFDVRECLLEFCDLSCRICFFTRFFDHLQSLLEFFCDSSCLCKFLSCCK
jgi:hypothetical protein